MRREKRDTVILNLSCLMYRLILTPLNKLSISSLLWMRLFCSLSIGNQLTPEQVLRANPLWWQPLSNCRLIHMLQDSVKARSM
jgi:hypothetical protein